MPQISPQTSKRSKPRVSKSGLFAACLLESLEQRRLLASVDITTFGAIPGDSRDDGPAITAAFRSVGRGDEVVVPAGTFNVNGSVNIPSGVTFRGLTGSKIDFKTSRNGFALVVASNASNVTITGHTIRANNGIVGMNNGSGYNNVQITYNDFVWGYDGTYYNRLAVKATVRSNHTIIEHNYFHDSSSSDRNVDLWSMSNSSYSYNKFYYVNDGGHICNSGDNVNVIGNVGRKIHRMGIEIQTWSGDTTNMTVANNVFYDWDRPWIDTFGLSVMPQTGRNIRILNNYMAATFTGPWGSSINGDGFGIGIEAGFTTGIVQGNTIVGPWVWAIAVSMPNTLVQGNKIYGTNAWGAIAGEPGMHGTGTFISIDNLIDRNMGNAPPPPEFVDGSGDPGWGGTGWPGPGGGDPPSGPAPTGVTPTLTAFVNDSTRISLSWGDTYSNETAYRVERSLTGMPNTFVEVFNSSAPNITTYADKGLPAGTKIWYRVSAYLGDVKGGYSNIVAATTRGAPQNGSTGGGGGGKFTQSFGRQLIGPVAPTVPGLNDDTRDSIFGDTGLL